MRTFIDEGRPDTPAFEGVMKTPLISQMDQVRGGKPSSPVGPWAMGLNYLQKEKRASDSEKHAYLRVYIESKSRAA